jgi:hypothetical protein
MGRGEGVWDLTLNTLSSGGEGNIVLSAGAGNPFILVYFSPTTLPISCSLLRIFVPLFSAVSPKAANRIAPL